MKFKRWLITGLAALSLTVGGCAGRLPVPGGTDTVNQSFYSTKEDLLTRLNSLQVGMMDYEVITLLGRKMDDLIRLERDQVVMALYGSNTVGFHEDQLEGQDAGRFLQSLYGYRLHYRIVEREHGFASIIRIRTDEKGFDYAVTLVFRNGYLYAPPILTGGTVNRSSSNTLFDYLNLDVIMDEARQY